MILICFYMFSYTFGWLAGWLQRLGGVASRTDVGEVLVRRPDPEYPARPAARMSSARVRDAQKMAPVEPPTRRPKARSR